VTLNTTYLLIAICIFAMKSGIRDELIAKGQCPQCESSKFKNDDLLPNINLRQAIDRFLEAQVTTSGASDSFYRQQQLPGKCFHYLLFDT
jgi:hypothetical protein